MLTALFSTNIRAAMPMGERRTSRGAGGSDHRTRVGRLRSSRTEARILSAALRVFAEKGPDAPVVDDFLAATGISRGTFYNHFASVPELLEATSVWTTDTTVASIDAALGGIEDPAVRFGTGLRLFLAKAQSDPVWSLFIARVWKLGPLHPARRDLRAGVRTGAFRVRDVEVALGVVLGGMRAALLEIGAGRRSMAYVDQVVELCLKALGVEAGRIAEVLGRELPTPRPHTAPNAARHGRKP